MFVKKCLFLSLKIICGFKEAQPMEEELKLLFLIPDPTFSHSGSGIFSFWIRRFLILDPAFPYSGSDIFSFWIRHFLILDPAFSHSGSDIFSFWIRNFLILDPPFPHSGSGIFSFWIRHFPFWIRKVWFTPRVIFALGFLLSRFFSRSCLRLWIEWLKLV